MTITIGKFIFQLELSIQRTESLVQGLQNSSFHPSEAQYETLDELGLRLRTSAETLATQVADIKTRREEEGKRLLAQAQSEKTNLMKSAELKDKEQFATNIRLFFNGENDSCDDSTSTKARKQLTRERCDKICSLKPDTVIFWAMAFHTWKANVMSKDTFEYIFKYFKSNDIKPNSRQQWPPIIYSILRTLGTEEQLEGSHKYKGFLQGLDQVQTLNQLRKRKRASNEATLVVESLNKFATYKAGSSQSAYLPSGKFEASTKANQQQRTEERIPNKGRTSIGISNLLNCDSNTLAPLSMYNC